MQILLLISVDHHKSNLCLLSAAKPMEVMILFLFIIHEVVHHHYMEGKTLLEFSKRTKTQQDENKISL